MLRIYFRAARAASSDVICNIFVFCYCECFVNLKKNYITDQNSHFGKVEIMKLLFLPDHPPAENFNSIEQFHSFIDYCRRSRLPKY